MDRKQIIDALQPLAKVAFSDEMLELSEGSSAMNVPGWTSLTFMHFLGSVESSFGIKFKITDLLTVKDIGGLINVIQKYCG